MGASSIPRETLFKMHVREVEDDYASLADDCRYLEKRAEALESENARLRELVDAWMGCGTRYHTMQGGCPMFDADAEDFCKATRLARELGIEVK